MAISRPRRDSTAGRPRRRASPRFRAPPSNSDQMTAPPSSARGTRKTWSDCTRALTRVPEFPSEGTATPAPCGASHGRLAAASSTSSLSRTVMVTVASSSWPAGSATR